MLDLAPLALAATILFAAATKLVQFNQFISVVQILGVRRRGSASAVALGAVIAELIASSLVLLIPRAGAIAMVALLGTFAGVAEVSVRRGIRVSCGCFGAASQEHLGRQTTLRNVLLASLAVPALIVGGEGSFFVLPSALTALLLVAGTFAGRRLVPSATRSRRELEAMQTAGVA